ncbi:monooxygenase [Prosthecomicrobium hirschii]|uniref:Trimethylamine monooxygenase n=1 Tax=Prosthecodimorpha hirschii TaxID=665126 RepID=A0A0P6VFT8_9HYPH|nr:NAD(P)-binding domain-containing protein [Prosthecomicrobium hirschii]KPL50874.1 monooxygenase [Prosthecomicrobium hirschii]
MVAQKTIAVIGAGVSGIAAAKAFAARGHKVTGFEAGEVFGGVWDPAKSYPDVQTQSPKELYRFTDMAMPDDYPEWPKGPQVQAYLDGYARQHRLAPLFRFRTRVDAMERRPDGRPGWRLSVTGPAGATTEDFDFVAVAVGNFSEKHLPEFGGEDRFRAAGGTLLHSSDYRDPAQIRGRRVVVLGASKSATDIAVNAARSGAKAVTLVCREAVWRVPYFVGGINFKRLLYMRAQEMQFNGWGRTPAQKLLQALTAPLVWANFRGLETLLKLQLGLSRWDMVPDVPIEKDVSCSIPIVTPGMFEAFRSGAIRPVRGTFEGYDGTGPRLTTGETIGADVVILATGWKGSLPFLGEPWRSRLIAPDGLYRLHRFAVNPDLPELGFVGFNSSFCTVLTSEMLAEWLVRFADGQLARQPSPAAMAADIEAMLHWRREERPAARKYGGLCVAPFHFKHFDELLADIGATIRKRANPLAEYFSFPDAPSFGRYLASAPQYRAD